MESRENNKSTIVSFNDLSIKSYPLYVAKFLNEISVIHSEVAIVDYDHSDYVVILYDKDSSSHWWLGLREISAMNSEDGDTEFKAKVYYTDFNTTATDPIEEIVEIRDKDILESSNEEDSYHKNFFSLVTTWARNIKEFNEIQFQNPKDEEFRIYQNDYEEKLEFVDTQEEYKEYYDIETQLKLDEYFNFALNYLEEKKTEENKTRVSEIQEDFKELKQNQTKYSKAQVKKKLATAWSKCRELSITLAVEITKTIVAEVFKKLVLGA